MKFLSEIIKNRNVQLWFGMALGSLIYSIGIVFALDLGNFFAGGVTGISQIITTALEKLFGADLNGVKSVLIVVINIPLILIGWKGVSRNFAIASVCSVGLQSLLIAAFEYLQDYGFNPFIEMQSDVLTLAILGGLLTGVGQGICLKFGSSSGGLDILSQYMSLNKRISFSKFTLIIDFLIIAGAVWVGSPVTAVYTIIRMIISVLVLDKIHTIYKYMKISIITDKKAEVCDALIKQTNHGITIYEAEGGFTKASRYVLESVISSYESFNFSKIAREVDPKCFITYTSIKKVEGSFNKNVIA